MKKLIQTETIKKLKDYANQKLPARAQCIFQRNYEFHGLFSKI